MDSTPSSFISHYYQDHSFNLDESQEVSLKDVFEDNTAIKIDHLATIILQTPQNQIFTDEKVDSLFTEPSDNSMLVDEIQDVSFYDELTDRGEIEEVHTTILPKNIDQLLTEKKDFKGIKKKRLKVIARSVNHNVNPLIGVVKTNEDSNLELSLNEIKFRKPRQWTEKKEADLIDLVKTYGASWKKISIILGFTKDKCRRKFISLQKRDQTLAHYTIKDHTWSEEQELKLIELVKIYGPASKKVSHEMGLTTIQCHHKYLQLLKKDPSLSQYTIKQHKWSEEQSKKLIDLVKKYGTAWKKISLEMGIKKEVCSSKFIKLQKKDPSLLQYSVKKHTWTEEDKLQLVELVKTYGTSWKKISLEMGLSAAQCYQTFLRLRKKDPSL